MDLKKILKLFEAPVGPGAIASTARASGIANPNLIKPGQQIRIPMQGGGEVLQTVKKGDTLSGIINRAQQTQNARAATAKPAVTPKPDVVGTSTAPNNQSSGYSSQSQVQKSSEPRTLPITTSGGPTADNPASVAATANPVGTGPRELPITTSGGPTADNPASVAATANPVGTGSGQVPSGPSDAQGYKVQTKDFIDTAKDFLSGTNKSPAPPTPAGTQDPTGRGNQDFYSGVRGAQTQAVPEPKIDNKSLTQVPPPTMAEEDELEEELNQMLRLSGINEKAVSKQQQKFMGMVHAMQKGKKIKGASPELKKAAQGMTKKSAHDFAATKHKGLPQRVSESVMLEAGSNLEHIVQRFKHETKNFLNGAELDDDLYNALYDYYVDNGEMPYGVAKAREGDPYQWVGDHFADALAMMGHQRQFQETVMPVVDNTLSELARLAGLSESQIQECGDMDMNQRDSMNVSTNMNSDGTKSVTISAQGDQAEALMQMLKLAGMGHMSHDSETKEPVVMVSSDDEMMDEEYANSPEEEYQTVDSITRQGNDLNREKRQYADKPKLGDNPMAEELVLDEELSALLDSILVREELTDVLKAEQPYRDEKTGKMVTPPKGATMPPADSPYPPGDSRNIKAPAAPKVPNSSSLPRPGVK